MAVKDFIDGEQIQSSYQSTKKSFSKIRILKNAFVLSAGFIIFFTAYDALSMLQSTINNAGGVGVASQAVIYACFSVSALLLPKYVIQKIGCKATLVISMICYVPYIASNFYPHWATMVPSAALLGLSASLLWGTQCTYLNQLSKEYAKLSFKSIRKLSNGNEPKENYLSFENHSKSLPVNESMITDQTNFEKQSMSKASNSGANCNGDVLPVVTSEYQTYTSCASSKTAKSIDDVTLKDRNHQNSVSAITSSSTHSETALPKLIESTNARFFGIFGMAYLSTHALSNMMSYFVLERSNVGHGNFSNFSNFSCNCGPDFCSSDSYCISHNTEELSYAARNILTGVCVSLSLFSIVLVIFFLDSLDMEKKSVSFSLDLLMATFNLSKKKEQLFLTPLSFYVGMIQGFYAGDFTKSYIGCAWGTNEVSLVSICFGAACSLSSTLSGYLVSAAGRVPTFLVAEVVNVGANVLLLMWHPDPTAPWMFFLAAGLWGAFVGTFFSQHRAFYGILFKKNEEAAFAAFYLWYSLGFCLSFAYSNYLCIYVKIYILLSVSTVGILGYIYVEMFLQKHKNDK